MASNPTPENLAELIASGSDMCDGLHEHEVLLNIKSNKEAETRAGLNSLISAQAAMKLAEGAEPAAYTALRTADSNGKGYLARCIKVLSLSLGNKWSDLWLPTGLPDNSVGIPSTQDKRYAAVGAMKAYFTASPAKEVADPKVNVTAAAGDAAHEAIRLARKAVNNAQTLTKDKLMHREAAKREFQLRYRACIEELERLLSDEDARWYDFGLNRPSDPAQPGQPAHVQVSALGGARVLVQVDGTRRANSFNYHKQQIGTDPAPVKLLNDPGTQQTFENLPVGATIQYTINGVNDAREGQPSLMVV